MAGTKTKNEVCSGCGADVRPNAEFCYNCGEEISPPLTPEEQTVGISDVWLKEDIQEGGEDIVQASGKGLEEPSEFEAEEKPANYSGINKVAKDSDRAIKGKDGTDGEPETKADDPIPKPKSAGEAKLKTAASIRKKSKKALVNQEEIVWQEYDQNPNIFFLLVAFGIVLGVVALFYIAMYLK